MTAISRGWRLGLLPLFFILAMIGCGGGSSSEPAISNALQYIIVSAPETAAAWKELASWKIRKGVPTVVATTQEIYELFPADEPALALRHYLQTMYRDYPTLTYVLLGGDTPAVPHCDVFGEAEVLGSLAASEWVASDLYFADLDGDWDGNGNGVLAEPEDGVDGWPDLYVGRLPVDSAAETENLVRKILHYEQAPPADYISRVLLLSEDTGYFNIDSSLALEPMAQELFPADFSLTKLYQNTYTLFGAEQNTRTRGIAAFNEGYGLVCHLGHGGYDSLGLLSSADLAHLSNEDKPEVMVSTACWAGAFQWTEGESAGEYFILNPQGGCVAYTGYTGVGLGYPSGLNFAESFFRHLFSGEKTNLGRVYGEALKSFADKEVMSQTLNPDRYTRLAAVLLGDPEMPIWTHSPQTMTVTYELNRYQLQVKAKTPEGAGISGVRVTAADDSQILASAETDAYGNAELNLADVSPESFYLTLTAAGYLPWTKSLTRK